MPFQQVTDLLFLTSCTRLKHLAGLQVAQDCVVTLSLRRTNSSIPRKRGMGNVALSSELKSWLSDLGAGHDLQTLLYKTGTHSEGTCHMSNGPTTCLFADLLARRALVCRYLPQA